MGLKIKYTCARICTSKPVEHPPRPVKVQMYRALIRPHLKYDAAAWDPYTQKNIRELEMVRRRAARFVVSNYSREPGTVNNITSELQWPTLERRRTVSRLCLLHKAINNQVAYKLGQIPRSTRTASSLVPSKSETACHQTSWQYMRLT